MKLITEYIEEKQHLPHAGVYIFYHHFSNLRKAIKMYGSTTLQKKELCTAYHWLGFRRYEADLLSENSHILGQSKTIQFFLSLHSRNSYLVMKLLTLIGKKQKPSYDLQ